jgi:hypothetical protein
MLRPVTRLLVALAVLCAALLSGCGGGPSDSERVHTAVQAFGAATAAKDYQRLCDTLLAPKLVQKVESVGLPCEVALRQGLGSVQKPTLTIGRITVKGDTATAEVQSSAAGEAPSHDTLQFVRVAGEWRIASLG